MKTAFPSAPIPGRLRHGTPQAAHKPDLTSRFPWFLFLITWTITFLLEGSMDAPALAGRGITVAELTEASDGSIIRKLLISLLGFVGVYCLVAWKQNRLQIKTASARSLVAYLAWIAITTIGAEDPSLTIKREIALALTLLFAAACAARMNVHVLSLFIVSIPLLNLLPGCIAELRNGSFHPLPGGSRFTGIAVHPNVEAAILSLAAIIVCWLAWTTVGRFRYVLACSAAIVVAFLFMTGSRTSILAFATSVGFLALLVILRDYKHRLLLLIAVASVLVGIVGLSLLFLSSTSTVSLSAALDRDHSGDVANGNGRLDLWKSLLTFAAERPLFGSGFGGFWSENRIEIVSEDQGWAIQQSHSAYIDQLLSLGFPGAALYIVLLVCCFCTCVIRFFCNQDGYGAWAGVLLIIMIVNFTESINISPVYPNFVFNLIVLHVALVRPRSLSANTSNTAVRRLKAVRILAANWGVSHYHG